MEERVRMFLKGTKWIDPIFIYSKKGILLNKGTYKGFNLTENYKGNECNIIELLDNISSEGSKHIKDLIKMVKEDLQNGVY